MSPRVDVARANLMTCMGMIHVQYTYHQRAGKGGGEVEVFCDATSTSQTEDMSLAKSMMLIYYPIYRRRLAPRVRGVPIYYYVVATLNSVFGCRWGAERVD